MIFLAEQTVKSYRKRIRMKLNSRNLVHSVAIAIRNGWM